MYLFVYLFLQFICMTYQSSFIHLISVQQQCLEMVSWLIAWSLGSISFYWFSFASVISQTEPFPGRPFFMFYMHYTCRQHPELQSMTSEQHSIMHTILSYSLAMNCPYKHLYPPPGSHSCQRIIVIGPCEWVFWL